jgi:hypothetical protein
MIRKQSVLLLGLALAALGAAGCGAGSSPLPHGGKGLLSPQPLGGNPGGGKKGGEASSAAGMKAAEKNDPG